MALPAEQINRSYTIGRSAFPQAYMEPEAIERQQRGDTGNMVEVLLGTAAEGLADMASFGLWQPDFVPQWQEDLNPYASMIGRMGGNLVGLMSSITATKTVLSVGLRSFKFGSKLYAAGQMLDKGSKVGRGITGMMGEGSAFAVHDVAREFIRQSKEEDPDAWNLGMAAAKGFFTGGIFGGVSEATKFEGPLQQLMKNGAAMTAADAITYSMEGEEITPPLLAQSFLMGMAFTAATLPGLKGRRTAHTKSITDDAHKYYDELTGDTPVREAIRKVTGYDEAVAFGGVQNFDDAMKQVTQARKVLQESKQYMQFKPGKSKMPEGSRGAVRGLFDKLGLDDAQRKAMVKDVTNGRSTSTKSLTRDEGLALYQMVDDVFSVTRTDYKLPLERMESWAGKPWVTPADHHMTKVGLADFIKDAKEARLWMDVEKSNAINIVNSMIDLFDTASSKSGIMQDFRKAKAFIENKPTDNMKELRRLLELPRKELNKALRTMNKDQAHAVRELRSISDFYYHRTNNIRATFEQEPIKYIDGYFRKLTKGDMIENPSFEQIGKGAAVRMPGAPENPTALQRTGGGTPVKEGRDLVARPLINMINNDLQNIYLHSTTKLMSAKVNALEKTGVLTTAEKNAVTYFMNNVILQRPSEVTKSLNKKLKRFLQSKPGKSKTLEDLVNSVGGRFFGREISDRPGTDLANAFNKGISRGMIGARASLALRNMLQSFQILSFAEPKYLAKAFATNTAGKAPKELDDILETIPSIILSKQTPYEGAKGTGRPSLFASSHHHNVDVSALTSYYQTLDNIIKDVPGWADDAGRALRKTNKKAISSGERSRMAKEIEYNVLNSQYLYHITGLPGIFQGDLGRAAFKLQTWPMNYVARYLDESVHRLKTGSPRWDTTNTVKLTSKQRLGIFTHFIASSIAVNSLAVLGLDYSSMVAFSLTTDEKATGPLKIGPVGVRLGAFNFRPSPGINALLGLSDMMSSDEYTRAMGTKDVMDTFKSAVIPNFLLYRDIERAVDEGDPSRLFLKKEYTRNRKRANHGISTRGRAFPGRTQPFGTFGE